MTDLFIPSFPIHRTPATHIRRLHRAHQNRLLNMHAGGTCWRRVVTCVLIDHERLICVQQDCVSLLGENYAVDTPGHAQSADVVTLAEGVNVASLVIASGGDHIELGTDGDVRDLFVVAMEYVVG